MERRGGGERSRGPGSSAPPRDSAAIERERRTLLASGEAVISEKGFPQATAEDVCTHAELDTAVFYRHFLSMGALLRVLSEMYRDQVMTVIDQSTQGGIWKGAPARDVIEVAVRSVLDVKIDRQGLVRALLAHGAVDPSLHDDLREAGAHLSQRLVAVMGECTNAPARSGPAISFSLQIAAALANHYILLGDVWGGVPLSKKQLAEETSRLVCAYLGLQPTIAIRDDTPDAAPTDMIEAIREDEYELVPPPRRTR